MFFVQTAPPFEHDTLNTRLPEPPGKKRRGVLIVDDEEMIRTLLGLFFRQQGIPFWIAGDGAEAITTYQDHADEIGLVLLDVRMPGDDGPKTLARLQEIQPNLLCYFMSGDWTPYTAEDLIKTGARGLIVKPLLLTVLGGIVRQCFANV